MSHVFVTVGTTEFDGLVRAATSPEVLKTLYRCGYREMVLQIGSGRTVPDVSAAAALGLRMRHYRTRPSIADDMAAADLVIAHAGAGTCLEALRAGRPLLVAVNTQLMDDHQLELAQRLAGDGYLLQTSCRTLNSTLNSMDLTRLKPFPPPQTHRFAAFLEELCSEMDS